MRILGNVVGIIALCVVMGVISSPILLGQDKKEESKKKLEAFEKEEEKKKVGTVVLQIPVSRDCKITVNNKEITYDKFEIVMEFAGNAFTIDELTYRGGQMSSIKLRAKE